MPYEGEAGGPSTRLGHVPTANNPKVQQALQRWTVSASRTPPEAKIAALCTALGAMPGQIGDSADVRFAITVDGSDEEVEATREFPTVKVGYIRVAGSLVDLNKFRELADDPFPDPVAVRKARESVAFDAALPGSGLQAPGMSAVDTWRHELNQFLLTSRIDAQSPLTLGDGLLSIHGTAGAPATAVEIRRCPSCGYRSGGPAGPILVSSGNLRCPEPTCKAEVFLADVLRLHEEYNAEGSNFSPITRAMNMAERLMTVCYIDHFFVNAAQMLGLTLFVTDGPLALHGPPAPQFRPMLEHMQHQMGVLHGQTPPVAGPMLVGIEKSGAFFDHARAIRELIPRGSVMMLTQEYINAVLGRSSDNLYGSDEFYGRRFIYRTTEGDTLVLTTPPAKGIAPYGPDPASEQLASYPTLRVICEVLDSLRTRMYEDAVIPIALAHSTAALPLGVGRSVLTRLAQENIPGLSTSHQAIGKPTYFAR